MFRYLGILLVFITITCAKVEVSTLNILEVNNTLEIECIDSEAKGYPRATLKTKRNDINITLNTSVDSSTLIYILLDTSIPMKRSFYRGIKPFLKRTIPKLLNDVKQVQVILATFDKNLNHVFDSNKHSKKSLVSKINSIKIKGQTTELWRNTVSATKEVSEITAKRKILLLISDGDAEDTLAYTDKDVIKISNKQNIRIGTLGYNERSTLYQNLKKLSENTKGKFWASNSSERLPKNFYINFLDFINSQFTIYAPVHKVEKAIDINNKILILLKQKNKTKEFTVDLTDYYESFFSKYKFFLLLIILLLLIATMLYWFLKNKKEYEKNDDSIAVTEEPPPSEVIAYLESIEGYRHEIYSFPATIGKLPTNNIVLEGEYISRNHAILDKKDEQFFITDRNSSNGIKVNGIRIKGTQQIQGKDKIAFGPYEIELVLE